MATTIEESAHTSDGGELVPGLRPRKQSMGRIVVDWITSTDHKTIGYMYLITAFVFFAIGGLLALVMRVELFSPGLMLQSAEQYNQFFTMHGTIMLLLFATP
ncbi:MAG: cbb3-type cytochrome c oxidase subunit I, partial [Actinomycetaceae bacterium]